MEHGNPTPRVLLAEDDRELRRLLATELRKDGFIVEEAASGFELLEHLGNSTVRNRVVDLIVTDIQLPGVNGLVVVEGLRNARHKTPILLITAFGDARTHARARHLGAQLLDKPFDLDDFRACARGLVSA